MSLGAPSSTSMTALWSDVLWSGRREFNVGVNADMHSTEPTIAAKLVKRRFMVQDDNRFNASPTTRANYGNLEGEEEEEGSGGKSRCTKGKLR